MFDAYNKLCGVKVNYQSIGSGGGIRQVLQMTVDFGGTDGIVTDQQKAQAKGGAILHIPIMAGAEAVVYNLPDIGAAKMKLTPDVIADIYLKKIAKWNDPRIASLNPDLKLPNLDIAVVNRSDGSGDEIKTRYTIVIVTHNIHQAARVSDYTAFMYLARPKERRAEDYITGRFG